MNDTLFGHLATNFASSPENLATEALCYILGKSADVRHQFRDYLLQCGVELPDLSFSTQGGDDKGRIPDMIGRDETGTELLLVESKFWAGLTDNQPNGYLERLSENDGSLLAFIAPKKRFATLWPELLRRLDDPPARSDQPDPYRHCSIESRKMALFSGEGVLNALLLAQTPPQLLQATYAN